jgi:hypothetical protein
MKSPAENPPTEAAYSLSFFCGCCCCWGGTAPFCDSTLRSGIHACALQGSQR